MDTQRKGKRGRERERNRSKILTTHALIGQKSFKNGKLKYKTMCVKSLELFTIDGKSTTVFL